MKFSISLITSIVSFALLMRPTAAKLHIHENTWSPDYVLVATAENVTINCQSRYSVIFNGTLQGPTLYMKENVTTWIRVYNEMPESNLTVHWHGLSQRAAPFSDGVPQVSQWPMAPFTYFDYEVRPEIGDAGTYFYHSHVGFQAVTAHGALIVEDADAPPYEYDDEITVVLADFYAKTDTVIEQGLLSNPFVWSGEPGAILLNGKSGKASFSNGSDPSCTPFVIEVEPDTVYRMRFIAGTAISFVTLGFEDHENLTIIEADGQYTKPASTDHLQLGSGQRFSLLFKTKSEAELLANGKTSYWIRYENRERPTNISGYALLQYKTPNNKVATLPTDLPSSPPASINLPRNVTSWLEYTLTPLDPSTDPFPPASEVTRTIYITMAQAIYAGAYTNGTVQGTLNWAQNNLSWQDTTRQAQHQTPYLIQVLTTGLVPDYDAALANYGWDPASAAFPARLGETLDVVWLSNSGPTGGWDFHPMHAHNGHYWDLGGGNGTYDPVANEKRFAGTGYLPAKRDTTILHRYAVAGQKNYTSGWRAWRMRVTDPGAWLMHCHILAHMVMGMQTAWVFGDAAQIISAVQEPYIAGYLDYGGDAYGNETSDPLVNHFFDDQ